MVYIYITEIRRDRFTCSFTFTISSLITFSVQSDGAKSEREFKVSADVIKAVERI